MIDKEKSKAMVRYSVYIEEEKVQKIGEVADFLGEPRQDIFRRAIEEFLDRYKDLSVYKCPNCDFSLKVNRTNEMVRKLIKEHEKECRVGKK